MNLATVQDTLALIGTNGERPYTKKVVTQPLGVDSSLLPFPFKLVDGGGAAHGVSARFQDDDYTSHSKRLCLAGNISEVVQNYLYNGSLKSHYTMDQINVIRDILIYWISGGTAMNCLNQYVSGIYIDFYTYARNGLKSYWAGYEALMLLPPADGGVTGSAVSFEICKMPIFYQTMLQNFEFSNYTYPNNAVTNTIPNVSFDLGKSAICVFNGYEYGLYIQTDKTTFASPLIIMGSKVLTTSTPYILHTRSPPTGTDSNFASAIGRCV